jgi:hypothetical protein
VHPDAHLETGKKTRHLVADKAGFGSHVTRGRELLQSCFDVHAAVIKSLPARARELLPPPDVGCHETSRRREVLNA